MPKRNRPTVHVETEKRLDNLIPEDHAIRNEIFEERLKFVLEKIENTTITTRDLFKVLGVNPEDQAFIVDLFKRDDLDFAHEMRVAMLARCKRLEKDLERQESFMVNDPEARQLQATGAEKHIHDVVTQLMAENDNATDPDDTVYPSLEYLKRIARSGKSQVVAYRRKHAAMLATHCAQHGWSDDRLGNRHNRMISKKYKAVMGDEEFTNEQA